MKMEFMPIKPSFDDPASLDDDTLNATVESLKEQLVKYEKVAKERKKRKNLVQLGALYIGDIFIFSEIEYKIVNRLSDTDVLVTTNFKGPRVPYVMNSSTYVKKVDDQK